MRRVWLWLAVALPAAAHVVSMSTGELRLDGKRATYELRMPVYEIAHVTDPASALLAQVKFTSGAGPARLVEKSCAEESGQFVCKAVFQFRDAPDSVEADCTLSSVTVPNHVHMLRALYQGRWDQAVFDSSFTHAELRFRPPSEGEKAVRGIGSGIWRAVAGFAQILFLVSLVLASRTRRELLLLASMLLAGELAAYLIAPQVLWRLSPRFIEAAAALTVAYLATEILLLPQAGTRWVVVAVLGLFHGLYFALLAGASLAPPAYFLAGVGAGELLVIGALAFPANYLKPMATRALAGVLLVTGLVWFGLRLRG